MPYPALDDYLARLYRTPQTGTRVWLDAEGRAQGRFFNSTLTSAFQPIHKLGSNEAVGFEAFARSYSDKDEGLYLWKLLDRAASDDESVELDRLCRMLHAINFYRQPEAADKDLFLSVHARLLAAVDGNHGIAFRRVLNALNLPHEKIVLQLPLVTQDQGWLLNYVSDNYVHNGFRLAVNAANAEQALVLLDRVRPNFIKLNCHNAGNDAVVRRLLEVAARSNAQIIFKRIEEADTVAALSQIARVSECSIYMQGIFWNIPNASLAELRVPSHSQGLSGKLEFHHETA